MSVKNKVNLADKYRVLITEVLPYELPLWFSNDVFYDKIKKKEGFLKQVTKAWERPKDKQNYIPLDYKIRRTGEGTRTLSIMHPEAQIKFCDFYEKYQDLIIYYCNRSQQSLRYPAKVVSSFYKTKLYDKGTADKGIEENDKTYANFISFFKYEKYPFLYKFFESYDYNKLEKRFPFFMQVDVNKCFNSIYTHSISWATKSKAIAKRNIGAASFDNEFDRLMQSSNYSETNGILIGAEISRIFAEIIFQSIDLNIISNLEKENIQIGVDYDFRRYVDDYFIYYNASSLREKIIYAVNAELSNFKMSLNEAKTSSSQQRPFITNITLCKQELSDIVKDIFHAHFSPENKKLIHASNPGKKANELISKIKAVVKRHEVNYSSISNFLFSIYMSNMNEMLVPFNKEENLPDQDEIAKLTVWLLIDIDILYFIHAMDTRIVSTDKLSRIILKILQILRKDKSPFAASDQDLILKKIFDMSVEAIKIFKTCSNSVKAYSVEVMNILLLLTKINDKYKLGKNFLIKYFYLDTPILQKRNADESFYFLWGSLMLYIQKDEQYCYILSLLTEEAIKFFDKHPHGFESAEFFMFWCDFMACPYIARSTQIDLVKKHTTMKNDNTIIEYINKFRKDSSGLIIDWSNNDWLDNNTKKKVFKYAYE